MVDKRKPAFPVIDPGSGLYWHGLTIRDWFAGQVLAGIASDPEFNNMSYEITAQIAYAQADAMMTARSEG